MNSNCDFQRGLTIDLCIKFRQLSVESGDSRQLKEQRCDTKGNKRRTSAECI